MHKHRHVSMAASAALLLTGCSSGTVASQTPKASANPAQSLTTDAQKASISTITDIDDGLFYTMDYTADYKLDEVLNSDITSVEGMVEFLQQNMLTSPVSAVIQADAGCSAFTVTGEDGHILNGRNFDYKMDMTAVLIRTSPENGYRSIGLADAGWLGYGIGSLDDGTTDLSLAVSFPYLIMDGMNEKGLSVGVLKLDGDPTQQDTGKHKVMTTVAMRLVLDRCATVDEAIELLQQYDMQSAIDNCNFHFILSDSSGRCVILEYTLNDMQVLEENHATNYYLAENMDGLGHGKDRYQILDDVLSFRKNVLTEQEAMNLLETVSQPETEESTSMTQWSVLYDLTDLSAQVAIRRDFSKIFKFTLDDISGTAQ